MSSEKANKWPSCSSQMNLDAEEKTRALHAGGRPSEGKRV